MITKLCEMAATYHTDKAGWYTPFYDLLLGPRRLEFRKILEVGIGTKEAMGHMPVYMPGASLFMWHDFFPDAEIWGVDVEARAIVMDFRIHTVHSDSRDPELAAKLPSNFDLIVDDGDHSSDAQLETFENLFPLVSDGGLYIIEDAEDYIILSASLEGYTHQTVLCPFKGATGKLIVVQK